MKPMTLILVTLLILAPAALAEEMVEIRDAFLSEARLLDSDLDQYDAARERESDALDVLKGLNQQIGKAMADPNVSPAALLELDREAAQVRATACTHAEETEEIRRGLFERMQRMADLVKRIEQLGVEIVGLSGQVGGMWKIEAQPQDVYGLMSLKQEGNLVRGTYRLSNGRRGSVEGSFAGDRLELDLIDSVEGTLTEDASGIDGHWETLELAAGRPSRGEWSARWISLEAVLDL